MSTRAMKKTALIAVWLTACATAPTESDPAVPAEAMRSDPPEVSVIAPVLEGPVARAVFTSGVVEREPQNRLTTLSNDVTRIYYFTEFRGMEGKTVIHRWEYEGKPMGEVAFDVGGPRWRVYSIKTLDPEWVGEWAVKVVDVDGAALRADGFMYVDAGGDVDPDE